MQNIVFGAGCFWGVQTTFNQQPGVDKTEVGYAGGDFNKPTYQDVCTGTTGHAEVVSVWYDPNQTSLNALLEVFWACHNPSLKDRQGPDVGSQYRSCIFYTDDAQLPVIEQSKQQALASGKWSQIVTEIAPLKNYQKAEEYHQHYHEKQGR